MKKLNAKGMTSFQNLSSVIGNDMGCWSYRNGNSFFTKT